MTMPTTETTPNSTRVLRPQDRSLKSETNDIQGNIFTGYKHPIARYTFLTITNAGSARRFLARLIPEITTAKFWGESSRDRRPATTNVGFTYRGLAALGLPRDVLGTFPDAFRQGMRARAHLLGDTGDSAPERWEPMWHEDAVHIWVSINGRLAEDGTSPNADYNGRLTWLRDLHETSDGVKVVYEQEAHMLRDEHGRLTAREHFGYADGFGQPDIEGLDPRPGGGRPTKDGGWVPIRAGEFLLGHRDESRELPAAPNPHLLGRNGTFMVYRKLHQNVQAFRDYLAGEAEQYMRSTDGPDQTQQKAEELLAAKLVGRWRNGMPLVGNPTEMPPRPEQPPPHQREGYWKVLNDFRYEADPHGAVCPLGAHIRRANPRDGQHFHGVLANRHRIIRRGLPYGWFDERVGDTGEHGIIFMALNASIERQFELVQRDWMNSGDHVWQNDDKDVLIGDHDGTGKAVIQADPDNKKPTRILCGLPRFVTVRGGDYFFLPSITALRLIADNAVEMP